MVQAARGVLSGRPVGAQLQSKRARNATTQTLTGHDGGVVETACHGSHRRGGDVADLGDGRQCVGQSAHAQLAVGTLAPGEDLVMVPVLLVSPVRWMQNALRPR